MSRRTLWGSAAAAAVICLGLGIWGVVTRGFESHFVSRLDERQRLIWAAHVRTNLDEMYDNGDCRFHGLKLNDEVERRFEACHARYGKAVVVIGDSHAMDLFNAISYNSRRPFILGLSSGGCHPQAMREYCYYEPFVSFAEKNQDAIEKVIFNQAGFMLIEETAGEANGSRRLFARPVVPLYRIDEVAVERTIDYLARISRFVEVTWLGPWIEPHLNGAQLVKLSLRCELKGVAPRSNKVRTFELLDAEIDRRLAAIDAIDYVSAVKGLRLDWSHDLYGCEGPYWNDRDHFSALGEQRFGERLVGVLDLH